MSNNRKLGNLAQFLDSGSTKSVITASGGAFATEPLLQADLTGTQPSGLSDSNLVKNIIDINYITETSGYASVSNAIPVVLQNTNNIIPNSSGAYDLGDSAKPIAELILDSSATIFFGAFSLTSILKSGTSSIAVAAVAASAEPVSGSAETTFLLKADSTQTDAQVDASTNALTITENGNVTSTAFTPYHPKGYSTYHPGTDDDGFKFTSITAPGSGNFTYECWIYATEASNDPIMETRNSNTAAGGFTITAYSDSSIRIWDTAARVTATGLDYIGKWTHVAVVKNGSTTTLYIDGTSQGTTTAFGTHNDDDLHIGYSPHYSDGFIGYISDFRYTTNAVYTSDFTPPTEPLTAISGTQVLTSHLPYIADGSTNAHSVTFNGITSTKQFGPHDHVAYSPSLYGGSVYFDGTGDYLTATQTNEFDFGTGDFTIDFWYYPTVHKNWSEIWDTRTGQYTAGSTVIYVNQSGQILFYVTNGSTGTNAIIGGSLKLNAWSHVEVSRSSGSTKMFINGVQSGSTYTDTNDYTSPSTSPKIGTDQSTQYSVTGYIADFRVINGTALNTSGI